MCSSKRPVLLHFCTVALYELLPEREVKKMAWYWPSSIFARLWTKTKSRSINLKKCWALSSHLDQTSLVNKRFIIQLLWNIFLPDILCSPEHHLSNTSTRFILSARGASHIIIMLLSRSWSGRQVGSSQTHVFYVSYRVSFITVVAFLMPP